jgi:hypothetical protein
MSTYVTHDRSSSARKGLLILALCFLAISVPVETAYSWRQGLAEPYYLIKLVGWLLLAAGAVQLRKTRLDAGVAFLAGGWGWLAANFARAVADRFGRLASGQALRLGSIELWFAGGCLLVSSIGLVWCLVVASRRPVARSM